MRRIFQLLAVTLIASFGSKVDGNCLTNPNALNQNCKGNLSNLTQAQQHHQRHSSHRHNNNVAFPAKMRHKKSRGLASYLSSVYYDDLMKAGGDHDDISATTMTSLGRAFDKVPWPIKKEAVVEGNVILGGLMMVHEREDNMTCGPIMPQGGIQALEAMLYTLDRINAGKLLPNVSIGAHILDDCDKDTYGLEMAVDFIKGEFFGLFKIQNF